MYALVSVRSSAHNRNDCVFNRRLAKNLFKLFLRNFITLKEFLHEFVVLLCDCLDKLVMIFLSNFLHVFGDFLDTHILAQIIIINVCVHLDKVNNALKRCFCANRKLNRDCVAFKPVLHHLNNIVKIGAHNVHLIYISHSGDLIFVCLTPNGF